MRAAEGARPSGVITITTDFGHQGPFVGVIKGCILTRFPAARLIDLTHEIVVHWPAEAGFWLARAFSYFPRARCTWRWSIPASAPHATSSR